MGVAQALGKEGRAARALTETHLSELKTLAGLWNGAPAGLDNVKALEITLSYFIL